MVAPALETGDKTACSLRLSFFSITGIREKLQSLRQWDLGAGIRNDSGDASSPEGFTPQGGFPLNLPGSQPVQAFLSILFLACARVQEEEREHSIFLLLEWHLLVVMPSSLYRRDASKFVCVAGLRASGET